MYLFIVSLNHFFDFIAIYVHKKKKLGVTGLMGSCAAPVRSGRSERRVSGAAQLELHSWSSFDGCKFIHFCNVGRADTDITVNL